MLPKLSNDIITPDEGITYAITLTQPQRDTATQDSAGNTVWQRLSNPRAGPARYPHRAKRRSARTSDGGDSDEPEHEAERSAARVRTNGKQKGIPEVTGFL